MATYTHEEAQSLVFLMRGVALADDQTFYDAILATNSSGIDFVDDHLLPLAKTVERVYRNHFLNEGSPVPWQYEIVEPMGHWFIEKAAAGYLPSDEEITETVLAFAYGQAAA